MLIALALAVMTTAADTLTGPGISHTLAMARAKQISAVRYELRMDVTNRDTLSGHATVRFARQGNADVILDFRGYGFSNVRANDDAVTPVARNGHLVIPARALRAG